MLPNCYHKAVQDAREYYPAAALHTYHVLLQPHKDQPHKDQQYRQRLIHHVYLSTNPVQHQRTKHVEIDLHFIRDRVAIGDVRVLHVPTTSQFADIFTKGLPSSTFSEFWSNLNVASG
jgi:hypothetical protein